MNERESLTSKIKSMVGSMYKKMCSWSQSLKIDIIIFIE